MAFGAVRALVNSILGTVSFSTLTLREEDLQLVRLGSKEEDAHAFRVSPSAAQASQKIFNATKGEDAWRKGEGHHEEDDQQVTQRYRASAGISRSMDNSRVAIIKLNLQVQIYSNS